MLRLGLGNKGFFNPGTTVGASIPSKPVVRNLFLSASLLKGSQVHHGRQ